MGSATKKKPTRGKTPKRTGRGAPSARKDREPERSAPQTAEIDAEVLEFIEAIDRFKKQNGRPFPSWSEVLTVLRELGYRRE
jgi:hypothetical protein